MPPATGCSRSSRGASAAPLEAPPRIRWRGRSPRSNRRLLRHAPSQSGTARYLAAFLDVAGRRCLVVGGGPVGERKVQALLAAGARVVVVSPALTPALGRLAAAARITHRARPFRPADATGAVLVVAATGIEATDRAVAAAARRAGALVNTVDRPALSDLIFPSVLRRGALQIAVSTSGQSPALAREIRRSLERLFPREARSFVDRVGRARARAREAAPTRRARIAAAERVARAALAARPPWQLTPGALRGGTR